MFASQYGTLSALAVVLVSIPRREPVRLQLRLKSELFQFTPRYLNVIDMVLDKPLVGSEKGCNLLFPRGLWRSLVPEQFPQPQDHERHADHEHQGSDHDDEQDERKDAPQVVKDDFS